MDSEFSFSTSAPLWEDVFDASATSVHRDAGNLNDTQPTNIETCDSSQPKAFAAVLETISDLGHAEFRSMTPDACLNMLNRSTGRGFVMISATLSADETCFNDPPGCEIVSWTTPKLTR